MMSSSPDQRESARQRALRIRLEYVHHRDGPTRFKLLLTLLAGLVAAAYCGWVTCVDPSGPVQFAPHRVASVHQHFEHDCQACHPNFVPLRADASPWPAWLSGAAPRPELAASGSHADHAFVDRRCQACHFAAPHHRLERPADVTACSTCHQEHRGDATNLRQVANDQCTNCHRQIGLHRTGPSSLRPELQNVEKFATATKSPGADLRAAGHPQFRSLTSDPGTIKFQHHLHLLPGLPAKAPAGRTGRPLTTLADLPPDVVERYRRTDQAAGRKPDHEYLVQLDCASCHRTEDAAGASGPSSPPSSGAYYRPIDFDRDCRACHPLTFDANRPESRLPHGLQGAAISNYLTQFYAAAPLREASADSSTNPSNADREPWRPQRPVPGRSGDPQARADVERTVAQQVTLAQQYLRRQGTCTKCHDERVVEPTEATAEERSPQVAAAAIPAYWLRHARFSHAPHQTLFCGECHAAANPAQGASERPASDSAGAAASRSAPPTPDRDLVMIAGRDTCVRCHSQTSATPGATGAVRSDCVLCHHYHGADHATRPAATPADPPRSTGGPRRTIADWLAPTTRPK